MQAPRPGVGICQ